MRIFTVVWLALAALLLAMTATAGPRAEGELIAADARFQILGGEPQLEPLLASPAAHWRSYQNDLPRHLPSGKTLWLRVQLPERDWGERDWVLSLQVGALQHVRLHTYNPDTGERTRSPAQGVHYPQQPRYQSSRQLAFPLPVTGQQALDVYLEIRHDFLYRLPLTLFQAAEFERQVSSDLLLMGMLHGILLVMLFYNLGLAIALRATEYLYYVAYVACVFWYLASITGVGPYYAWGDQSWLMTHGTLTAACATFLASAVYLRKLLQLHRYGPWIRHFNGAVILFWLVMLVVFVISPDSMLRVLVSPGAIVTSQIALVVAVYLSLKGVRLAWFFTAAWSALFLGTITFSLMLEGILPFTPLTAYSQMVGVVVELVILAFALAYRIQELHAGREQAQQLALDRAVQASQERSQRLQTQQEMLALQQDVTQRLEQQVQERTRQLADANQRLTALSRTDPLTGLGNRRMFDEALQDECRRSRRSGHPLAVVLVDIDHFKPINDAHGHTVGDECICAVARALQSVIGRPGDLLARFGGEEFVYILSDTDLEQAQLIAERARQVVAELDVRHDNRRIDMTVSLGVAARVVTGDGDGQALVAAADQALYEAKRQGRNRVEVDVAGDLSR